MIIYLFNFVRIFSLSENDCAHADNARHNASFNICDYHATITFSGAFVPDHLHSRCVQRARTLD